MALAAALAERQSIWLGRHLEGSISLLPTLFAAVLFGPLAAMIVGALSMAGGFRRPYMKWAVYTCSRSITGAAAGLVAGIASGLWSSDVAAMSAATVTAAVTAETIDAAFAAITYKVRGNRMRDVLKPLAPVALVAVPLYAPLVTFLALAYQNVSPLCLPLFLAPALAAQRLYGLYQDQRRLTEAVVAVNERLESANLSFASALVAALDDRDQYTAGHSAAVAIYARDIAKRLGLGQDQQQTAHLCGLVHDIGKIGLPPGLLEKPGALTLEEHRQMQAHVEKGERILSKVDDYAEIASIVRHHHERWDGNGYPDKLTADSIPLLSRIIAVADAYNAMTSDRPYRDAMPSRVARMRLAQAVESQFDTTVVAAFEALLAGAAEGYRCGTGNEFTLEGRSLVQLGRAQAA